MATRTERVVLELEDNFTTGMAKAAAATALLKRELSGLDGSSRKASASTRSVGDETDRLSNHATRGARSIDQFSGRLGLLLDTATALGPALVPIGGAGVAAVSALASGLGFATVGAGSLALAFNGVGDALSKVNKAELEPTAANLHAAHLALSQLPPDARAFVQELQRLRPEITRLQDAAGSGLFPGLTDGMRAVSEDAPLVERALHNIGAELGDLARDAGRSLSSTQWRPFLRFVGTEGPRELDKFGRATGSVTHGLAELWMAMSPLNRTVDDGILKLAEDFDRWATSLDKTQGFQDFVAYIQANGPRVVQLLGDTADLFVDIVAAAAPLGGPTLQALDLIVKALDAIVGSPLGTPILLLLQINSVLKLTGRALGGLGVDAKIGMSGVSSNARAGSSALRTLRADAVSAGKALQTIGTNVGKNSANGTPLLTGVNKEGLNKLKQGAALAGGLAFAMSGADQSMGLANTTALTLAGSLAGPVGAGFGAAAGIALDWKASIDADRKSAEEFQAALDALVEGDRVNDLQRISEKLHAARSAAGGGLIGDVLGDLVGKTDASLAEVKDRVDDLTSSQHLAAAAAGDFGHAEQVAARKTLAMRDAAKQTSDQFRAFGDNLDDAKVSLDKWIDSLAQQGRDLENFGNNAKRAADKGLRDGLIKALEEAGPAGARRMRQLADATQQEIGRANRAWGSGKKAADDYQEAVAYIANHPPVLSINGVPQSLRALRQVQSALAALRRQADTALTLHAPGGRVLPGLAGGGTVPGTRAPYGDKVVAALAPGEFVVSNRHGQADQHRALLQAINTRRYADGGTVAASRVSVNVSTHAPSVGQGIDYGRLADSLSSLRPPQQLYGDVHISGDPASFRREMERDRALASLTGVNR